MVVSRRSRCAHALRATLTYGDPANGIQATPGILEGDAYIVTVDGSPSPPQREESSVRETIAIDQHSITIRRRDRCGEHFSVFPRHGSAVKLHAPSTALHPSRLMLESRGQACEVGRFLTQDERRTLAARLKQLVGNVNETPAL